MELHMQATPVNTHLNVTKAYKNSRKLKWKRDKKFEDFFSKINSLTNYLL